MKLGGFLSRLLMTLPAVLSVFGGAHPVYAKGLVNNSFATKTVLTLTEMGEIAMGDPLILTGNLKDATGKPVQKKSILFAIDGEYLGQARTDDQGSFLKEIKIPLSAGSYVISASATKTRLLESSSSSSTVTVLPAPVKIQMVPPIAGVSVLWDEKRYVSDSMGLIEFSVDEVGDHQLMILADEYQHPSQRIEFGRWLAENYLPTATIQVPRDTDNPIPVGINVYHLVSQTFVDTEGKPVDPVRIKSYTIRSMQGDVFEFTDNKAHWIPASRVARRLIGLDETKLLYSVINVMVDGSNVVNQSQQRFYSKPGDLWNISLLFNSLRFSAKDAMFGSKVGNSINLTYPDGTVKNYQLGKDGSVEIRSLARGQYLVELVGVKGLSSRSPVALSRSQDMHVKVLTYLDLAVVGMFGMIAALGLLFYGRPGILTRLLKKPQPVLPKGEWAALFASRKKRSVFKKRDQALLPDEIDHANNRMAHDVANIDPVTLRKLLVYLQTELGNPKRNSKLNREKQLLLTFEALKGDLTDAQLGWKYGVSPLTVKRIVKRIKKTILKSDELSPLFEGVIKQSIFGNGNDEPKNTIEQMVDFRTTQGQQPVEAFYD